MEHSRPMRSVHPHRLRRKADFVQKCKLIRERLESRQSEVHGRWMTAEAMKKSGLWSAQTIKQMISYCRKFPESLIRLDQPGRKTYGTQMMVLGSTVPFLLMHNHLKPQVFFGSHIASTRGLGSMTIESRSISSLLKTKGCT